MIEDPYEILGVTRDVTENDLRKAYRKLAKKLHPDLNPGNRSAEDQFKKVATAYDLLSDPTKRAQFDRGEVDAAGKERPRQPYYRDYAESDGGHRYASDAGFSDLGGEDLFSQMFGRRRQADPNRNGEDVHYSLELAFLEAFNGGRRTLSLPEGPPLDMKVPPGTRTGTKLRLRGKGHPGMGTDAPGDALIEVDVRPDDTFRLDGDDIYVDLPISLRDAVLGGKVTAPAPSGAVTLTVPKWSSTGAILRLRGKCMSNGQGATGDQYVTLKLTLPEKLDAELEDFMTHWGGTGPDGARQRRTATLMETDEFRRRACIGSDVLDGWVDARWIIPEDIEGGWSFHLVDLARVQLIQDLLGVMGVNDEGVGIILDLVDQIGGLRHTVIHLSGAVPATRLLDPRA